MGAETIAICYENEVPYLDIENELTGDNIANLIENIANKGGKLVELDIGENSLNTDALEIILIALKKYNITNKGARKILELTRANANLTFCCMDRNYISNQWIARCSAGKIMLGDQQQQSPRKRRASSMTKADSNPAVLKRGKTENTPSLNMAKGKLHHNWTLQHQSEPITLMMNNALSPGVIKTAILYVSLVCETQCT